MKILTEKDVFKKEGLYKFVRVKGEYRFLNADSCSPPTHKQMLQDGEVAEAAGTAGVTFEARYWKMFDNYSSTLNVFAGQEDEKRLTVIFGCPLKEDY